MVLDEEFVDALESRQVLGHGDELLRSLFPGQVIEPVGGIVNDLDLTGGAGEEEAQLLVVHLVVTGHDVHSHLEGEEQLVSLEETTANVVVQ